MSEHPVDTHPDIKKAVAQFFSTQLRAMTDDGELVNDEAASASVYALFMYSMEVIGLTVGGTCSNPHQLLGEMVQTLSMALLHGGRLTAEGAAPESDPA